LMRERIMSPVNRRQRLLSTPSEASARSAHTADSARFF
jgi:hypothetical protein